MQLDPFVAADGDALRAACAGDAEIWHIYPMSWSGAYFDVSLADALRATKRGARMMFIVRQGGAVVGMTSYLNPDEISNSVEIGATYIAPQVRGSGLNGVMKRLMIARAFAAGFTRIEWRVDTRNARSIAAVLKLGATHEGTLRRNRVTWTGYVRDTAMFGLLRGEWPTKG